MATLNDARAGMTRYIDHHLQRDIEHGYLGVVSGGEYVFEITNSDGDVIKPGYIQCRIETGLGFEPSECIPRVALDPYTRCKFKRVGGALEAVEFVAQDGVRNYGAAFPALGVPALPMAERGGVGDLTPTEGNVLIANGDQFESRPLTSADIADLDASMIPFDPLTPADWTGPPATDAAALDELAGRVSVLESGGGSGGAGTIILIVEEQSAGTAGGTFTSGAWRTRTLNTVLRNIGSHASLSSNQITLDAGTYRLNADAPAFRVDAHQTRWQNVSDGATVALGTSEFCPNASGLGQVQTRSTITTEFTIAVTKTFELQHQCETSFASEGYGVSNGGWDDKIFSRIELVKIT